MALNTEHLGRCIQTLESSLKLLNQSEQGSTEYEIYRNAAIKGFAEETMALLPGFVADAKKLREELNRADA